MLLPVVASNGTTRCKNTSSEHNGARLNFSSDNNGVKLSFGTETNIRTLENEKGQDKLVPGAQNDEENFIQVIREELEAFRNQNPEQIDVSTIVHFMLNP